MGQGISKAQMDEYVEIVGGRFREQEIEHLYKLFHRASPDGVMGPLEFKRYVDGLQVFHRVEQNETYEQLFRAYSNRAPTITFQQFLEYHTAMKFGYVSESAATTGMPDGIVPPEAAPPTAAAPQVATPVASTVRGWDFPDGMGARTHSDSDGLQFSPPTPTPALAEAPGSAAHGHAEARGAAVSPADLMWRRKLTDILFNLYNANNDAYVTQAEVERVAVTSTGWINACDVESKEVLAAIKEASEAIVHDVQGAMSGRFSRAELHAAVEVDPAILDALRLFA